VFVASLGAPSAVVETKAQAPPASSSAQDATPMRQGNRAMVSWVVLSSTHVRLNVNRLRERLDEVYPGYFLPPRERGTFVLDGTVPGQFMIQSAIPNASGMFFLQSVPGPYTDVSDFAAAIDDRAVRRHAMAQRAWLSVDLIARHTTDEDAYRFIGRVLAKLAPADAAFLVDPEKRTTTLFDDEVRRRLANGEMVP
jgi:hypothetical protein